MARSRAADYDGKRQAILDRSAVLFSKYGYDRASINSIAEGCGISKALLYHYYDSKDEVLFDILRKHLQDLLDAVATVRTEQPARERLRELIGALLKAYRNADHQHNVQINELGKLPVAKQKSLKDLERKLVAVFAGAIAEVNPVIGRRPTLLKPVTMSLFGMLNWHYLWFREGKALSREDYAEMVTTIIVEGSAALKHGRMITRAA